MTSIVDAYGRPYVASKADVEKRTEELATLGFAFSTPMLPGRNPVLDDGEYSVEMMGYKPNEIRQLAATYQGADDLRGGKGEVLADSSGGGVLIPSVMYNERFMKATPISELNLPRDVEGVMNLSMRYAEDNYMVSTGVRIKKNFALKDMTITGTSTAKEHYQSEYDRLNVRKLLNNVFRYYWITGRVVVYWGEERPIKRCTIIDPRFIRVQSFLGEQYVFLKPDPRWRTILQQGGGGLTDQKLEKAFLLRNLPAWWIPYIMADEYIPLKPETYALIENDLSLFATRGIHTVGGTPLSAAFVELSIHRMLLAGDFSVAWMMKNMIGLVSIGDPEHEQNFQRSDTRELSKLQQAFQRPDYAMWAYVDPTVQIRYVTPDPDLLKGERYRESSAHIERVLAIPAVFSANGGKSGDFASDSLELKCFREEIQFGRDDVKAQLFGKLNPILREGHTKRNAGTKNPGIEFDNDCLVDDRILMEMLNGKFDRGAVSIQSLLEGKHQDIETERERKGLEEAEVKAAFWAPAYDVSHGYPGPVGPPQHGPTSGDGGTGGRPTTTGKPTNEKTTGSQQPRPSR